MFSLTLCEHGHYNLRVACQALCRFGGFRWKGFVILLASRRVVHDCTNSMDSSLGELDKAELCQYATKMLI